MDEKTISALDGIFDAHDAKGRAASDAEAARISREEAFAVEFQRIAADTILPAMEKVAEYVRGRGHQAAVTLTEERPVHANDPDSKVTITFQVRGDAQQYHERPFFSASGSKGTGDVIFSHSTMRPQRGGQSGPVGAVKLHEVTALLVEQKVLETIRLVFN